MKYNTIDQYFDYHAKNIIRKVIDNRKFKTAEELESFLTDHRKDLADYFLDDLEEWMGMDSVLKLVQEEE